MHKPIKSLRLGKWDRIKVRQTFRDAYNESLNAAELAARQALSEEIYALMYSPAELAAIEVLKDSIPLLAANGAIVGYTNPNKEDGSAGDDSHENIVFYNKRVITCGRKFVPYELIVRNWKIRTDRKAGGVELDKAIYELDGIMALARTRRELAALWPPLYDIMGKDWVEATSVPIYVPSITADTLNSLYDKIKPVTTAPALEAA